MDVPLPRTPYLNFKPSKQLDEANLELVSPMIKKLFPSKLQPRSNVM